VKFAQTKTNIKMKKLIFSGLFISLAFTTLAQSDADKLLLKAYKDSKEKSDKDIANPKANIKAKTWLDRGLAYEEVAIRYLSLDSTAADVAQAAYNKAIELDTKAGKEGSIAKDARKALSATNLFSAFMQQGAGNYTNKNYLKAQSAFKAANLVSPKDTLATMYYGVASQQLKDDKSIIDAYEKHVALGGKDPIVYYSLYDQYKRLKNDAKALEYLDKGITLNPDNKDLKAEKTNYYIQSGKLDQAIIALKEMAVREPKNANTLLNIAIILDNAGMQQNTEIRKLSDSINQGSDVQGKLDAKTSQVQAYTDERNRLKEQLKKQPKNADVKRRLGEAELFLKEQTDILVKLRADKAEEDAKKVNVDEVNAKIAKLTKERNANKEEAVVYYKKTLAIDPNSYDALFNMGVMSFNEGVEVKRPYDNMNPTTAEFKLNGKAMEDKFNAKFKEALPYFEAAYAIKKESEIIDNLKNVYRLLKMEDKLKALGE
jgi:predicted Zn-dependent protease